MDLVTEKDQALGLAQVCRQMMLTLHQVPIPDIFELQHRLMLAKADEILPVTCRMDFLGIDFHHTIRIRLLDRKDLYQSRQSWVRIYLQHLHRISRDLILLKQESQQTLTILGSLQVSSSLNQVLHLVHRSLQLHSTHSIE